MPRITRGRIGYDVLLGTAAGCLATGLLLPFVVGDAGSGSGAAATGGFAVAEAAPADDLPATAEPLESGDAATGEGPTTTVAAAGAAASPSAPGAAAPAASGRTASDVGITADSVKIGFLLIDVGGLDQIGIAVGITVEQQQAAVQALVDETNATGGIGGRKIVPVYRPVNLLQDGDGRAACIQLTEDAKVFMATGNVQVPEDALCYAREHRTPVLASNAFPDSTYAAGGGLVNSLQMSGGRLMRNWVSELDRVQYIGARKVGIVTSEGGDPGGETAGKLRAALEGAGHEVVHVSRLDADLHTGSSQIPVQVNQMRTRGAEVVLLMANTLFNQQWVQQADGQAWRPRYSVSGWSNSDNDGSTDNMPDSYEGTVGFTSIWPGAGTRPTGAEPPTMRACREVYERRSGRKLAAASTNEYGVTMVYCDLVRVLKAQLEAAGPNPTRAAFPRLRVGGLDTLSWMRGGTLAPGKPDVVDYLRLHRWSAGCHCYEAVEPFRKTRF